MACHGNDSIYGWMDGRGQSAGEMWRMQVYMIGTRRAAGAMCAQIHLMLPICYCTLPRLSLPSCPVAAPLSSERRSGKCRTSSAELALHSCWCQLPCPPSLLSPSLVPPSLSSFEKLAAATCWLQWETLCVCHRFFRAYLSNLDCAALQEFPPSW